MRHPRVPRSAAGDHEESSRFIYAVAVVSSPLAPVLVLNVQRDFQCRHSGACCAFGGHIPIEPATHALVADGIRAGHLRSPGPAGDATHDAWMDTSHPPAGAAGVLQTRADGACVFFDADAGRLCAIQRALGHDALPSACQQFPRVSLIDDRGAHVTFSHYCPTVAAMLLGNAGKAAEIVTLAGADAEARRRVEGFDARAAVPPFLRPEVAFDLPAYDAWERGIVRALGRPGRDPDATLAAIAGAAEDLRGWRPARGPLVADVERVLRATVEPAGAPGDAPHGPSGYTAMARLFDDVAASVPEGLPRSVCPPDWASADAACVAGAWSRLAEPVGRFLAAKAFASSMAWQGRGVRTQVMAVAAARAVLRIETARRAELASRVCDAAMLVEAARAADLLLEHVSDRQALISRWAGVEALSSTAFLASLGLEDHS